LPDNSPREPSPVWHGPAGQMGCAHRHLHRCKSTRDRRRRYSTPGTNREKAGPAMDAEIVDSSDAPVCAKQNQLLIQKGSSDGLSLNLIAEGDGMPVTT